MGPAVGEPGGWAVARSSPTPTGPLQPRPRRSLALSTSAGRSAADVAKRVDIWLYSVYVPGMKGATAIPLHEAKNRLSQVVHAVESGEPAEITRHGRSVAVLLSTEAYARVQGAAETFRRRYDRFRAMWPAEGDDEMDPFDGIRPSNAGRDVAL
jgi:prevent-host-death family protein